MFDVARIGHDSACEPLTGPLGRREVAGDPASGEGLRNGDTEAVLGAEVGEAFGDARGIVLVLFKAGTCVLYSESRGPGHDEERVPWIRLSAQVRSGLLRAE